MQRIVIVAALAAAAALPLGSRGETAAHAAASPAACSPACAAAYGAIAEALPRDRGNVLLRALLHRKGFDWTRLSGALHVPTAARIHEEWRRECEARYPGDPVSAALCYRLIFGP